MSGPTITVVIPTVARPTLARTLASLRDQDWGLWDEVLLVGDGERPEARRMWEGAGLPGRYLEMVPGGGCWGHAVRNWVQRDRLVRTSHRMQLDDDDAWVPGALATVRAAVAECPDRPHLFRMDWRAIGGRVLWTVPELVGGNVSTGMFVAPVDPVRDATWGSGYAGDFDHIVGTCAGYAGGPVWRSETIMVCRPHLLPRPRNQ